MIIAYGEANKAKWALDAQGNFRTLVISNKSMEEKFPSPSGDFDF